MNAFLKSWRRRVSPTAGDATAGGQVPPACPPAPFDSWSVMQLGDRALMIVTDDGVFERVGPRLWIGHSVGHTVAADPLAVCEWLEHQARDYYRQSI